MLESLKLSLHIARRNWAVYRKDFVANVSPTVADPAMILVSLGLGLGAFLTNIEGMSYMQFLAPGLTIATALFTSYFETSWGFYMRMTYENVYKAMLTTPIGVNEVVVGEFIWTALKGAAMGAGVGVFLAIFGLMTNPWLLPFVALVAGFVALACGSMGLIATSYVNNMNQFQTVYSFLIAPLYFLSGIFFPIQNMATPLRVIAEFFPLIHGVRLVQSLFWERGIAEAFAYSGSILFVQSAVFCAFAHYRLRKKLVL